MHKKTGKLFDLALSTQPSRNPLAGNVMTRGLLYLLLVAVLAAEAAQATPDPQQATQETMDLIGTAMFAWIRDQVSMQRGIIESGGFDLSTYPAITAQDLEDLLVPDYLDCLPAVDGWGNPFELYLNVMDPLGTHLAAIRSAGADGTVEGSVYTVGYVATTNADLVWGDGGFVRSAPHPDPVIRSREEMREIGSAMFFWLGDQTLNKALGLGSAPVNLATFPSITAQDLKALLVPRYLRFLPMVDGWGEPYDFRLEQEPLEPISMAVRSTGSDTTAEGNIYSYGYTSSDAEDLVWANGEFVRQPLPLPEEAQAVTLGQLASIGTAMFSWIVDQTSVTQTGPGPQRGPGIFDFSDYAGVEVDYNVIAGLLVPAYLSFLPPVDGWGNPYSFGLETDDFFSPFLAYVYSGGADGSTPSGTYVVGGFPSYQVDQDMIWADGAFARFPVDGSLFRDGFECGNFAAWTSVAP